MYTTTLSIGFFLVFDYNKFIKFNGKEREKHYGNDNALVWKGP